MSAAGTQGGGATGPTRIFVVEDEPLIRLLLEDMLQDLGYTVTAQAARIGEALQAARAADFDAAILDVNVNGEDTAPVADILATQGTPFIFVTGYGTQGLPQAHRDRPTLKKPFQLEGLEKTLQAALSAK
jgi:CheY-like chemotaxis protein